MINLALLKNFIRLFKDKSVIFTLTMTIFAFPYNCFAEIEVAFFEYRDAKGNLISNEPGGRFFHAAVKTEVGWVETDAYYGVIIAKDNVYLRKNYVLSLVNKNKKSISKDKVLKWLNKPYDFTFNWSTDKSTYCSKLVANLIDETIQPIPFTSKSFKMPNGKILEYSDTVGLSPDDLYLILTNQYEFRTLRM